MAGSARIESIDKLKEFRAKIIIVRDMIRSALSEADADAHRLKIWVSQEQKNYWQGQYRKRQEKFQIARRDLASKKNEKTVIGNRRSFVDEEKAFRKAQLQLEEAELKLKNIQRWSTILEKEIYNYKGLVQPITLMADEDLPKAAALLESMIISLEKYADITTAEKDSVTRNGEPKQQEESEEKTETKAESRENKNEHK